MERPLRRLPLRDATHELLEAFGILSLSLCSAITAMMILGGLF